MAFPPEALPFRLTMAIFMSGRCFRQHLARAGQSAARPVPGHIPVEPLADEVVQDFRPGRVAVVLGVGEIRELPRDEPPVLLRKFLGLPDRSTVCVARAPEAKSTVKLAVVFCWMMRRRIADVRKHKTARRFLAGEHQWLERELTAPAGLEEFASHTPEVDRPVAAIQRICLWTNRVGPRWCVTSMPTAVAA
jgi:hypothetical protein